MSTIGVQVHGACPRFGCVLDLELRASLCADEAARRGFAEVANECIETHRGAAVFLRVDAAVVAACNRRAEAVNVAVEVERASWSSLPLLEWVVKEHHAFSDSRDAFSSNNLVDAFEQSVKLFLAAGIVIALNQMQALARDAFAVLLRALDVRAVPVATAAFYEKITEVNQDVLRVDSSIDRVNHRSVHRINARVLSSIPGECVCVTEVIVGGDEDPAVCFCEVFRRGHG